MNNNLIVKKVIRFILDYEQDNGGFSFARTTPKTLEDTYFAIRALMELKYKYNNDNTRNYIKNLSLDGIRDAKLFYYLVWLGCCQVNCAIVYAKIYFLV